MRLWPLVALAAAACTEAPKLQCDGLIHFVEVDGAVCLDGSPTGFEYACHTLDETWPLVVILDGGGACGGGACGAGATCDGRAAAPGVCTQGTIFANRYGKADSLDGQLPDDVFGPGLYSGASSPFDGWNLLRIPYCTGDSHMGDAEAQLTNGDGKTYAAHFHGRRNVSQFLEQARGLFPRPGKVALTGTSAGGIGVDCSLDMFRVAWASPRTYAVNVARVPSEPPAAPAVEAVPPAWGAREAGTVGALRAHTCPIEAASGTTTWGLPLVELYDRLDFPEVKTGLT